MEKVHPWRSQLSDRGQLKKNRTAAMLVSEISSRVDADAPEAYFASENVVGPGVAEC